MKKKIKWVLAPLLAAILVAAAMPWTLSSRALRRELAGQVRSAVGFSMYAKGQATFALLPRPRIQLEDVRFSAPDGALSVQTSIVKGDLRILPLLGGRLELSSITLISPDVSVDLDRQVHVAGRLGQAMRPATKASAVDSVRLGTISIVSGTAHLASAAGQRRSVITHINATLDWRHLASPATLNGAASWRGTDAEFALWIANPAALLRGDQSPVDLKVDSTAGSLSMDGKLASLPNLQYDGHIAAHVPLLREAMQLFNVKVPLPGPLRDGQLAAEGRIDQNSIALSNLQMALDGNSFEGSLAMHDDQGRAFWTGTLATDLFALSPFLSDLAPSLTPEGQWSSGRIDASGLDFSDLDLRVSASRAHFGRILLENAGFSILLNRGRLEVTLADAKAYGGTLRGRASLGHGPAGLDLRLAADFSHVDSAALLDDIVHTTHVSGDADGQLTLEAHGDSLSTIMHSLAGGGHLALANGDISGLDLEQALRRMEKRPLSIATEVRTGRTSFTSAAATFTIRAGNAEIDQCVASGPGVDLAMSGVTGIGARSLDLHVLARQTGAEAKTADAPQLHLDLMGSWDDPVMVLDTESLVRRSAVAAPLLRSLGSLDAPLSAPAGSAPPPAPDRSTEAAAPGK